MNGLPPLAPFADGEDEPVWVQQSIYTEAERRYEEMLGRQHKITAYINPNVLKVSHTSKQNETSLVDDIAEARLKIINFMQSPNFDNAEAKAYANLVIRIDKLEKEKEASQQKMCALELTLQTLMEQIANIDNIVQEKIKKSGKKH